MMAEILRDCIGLIAQMEEEAEELQEQAKVPREAVLRLLEEEIARYN